MTESSDNSPGDDRICIGVVTGPHGLNGDVKIKSFTANPEDVAAYGPVTDKTGGQEFRIHLIANSAKSLVAKLSGVKDRTAAEAIKGTELYVSRGKLPELEEDEFYYSDLIGLTVEHIDGNVIGTVKLVDNYGAGEIIEVEMTEGRSEMFLMSREVVPEIDLKNGRIVVNPPTEIYADENHDDEEVESE